jgi:hypothetical protein
LVAVLAASTAALVLRDDDEDAAHPTRIFRRTKVRYLRPGLITREAAIRLCSARGQL